MLPDQVIQDSREKVAASGKMKQKKWLPGAVIILLWALLVYWMVNSVI